jgi:hypothetical protein
VSDSPGGKRRFVVLLDDPSELATDLQTIAHVVAESMGQPVADALGSVRYGAGILVRSVPEPVARAISRGLAALTPPKGSFLVEARDFQAPPRAIRAGKVELKPDGVCLAPYMRDDRMETYGWDDVLAIHAHALPGRRGSSEEGGKLPRRGGDMKQLSDAAIKLVDGIRKFEERERVQASLGLDILVAGPKLYRVSHDTPGLYASLPSKAIHALENYVRLIDFVLGLAAGRSTLVPQRTRRFRAQHEFGDLLYAKREELDNFNAWLIQALSEGISTADEVEDLGDDALEDAETAIVVGGPGSDEGLIDDAEDISDEELDELEDDDEGLDHSFDEDEQDEDSSHSRAPSSGASSGALRLLDGDIKSVMEHFDKTGQLDVSDLHEILAAAEALEVEEADGGSEATDPEIREAMKFFSEASGRWNLKDMLAGDELDPREIETLEALTSGIGDLTEEDEPSPE